NALELDVKNLLALDADRLLAGFRETACYVYNTKSGVTVKTAAEIKTFMKNKTRYGGGWENSLIGGHTLGHYMTAVAQGIINPGVTAEEKTKLTERLDYLIDALDECQQMTVGSSYEGYLFGATLPNTSFQNDPDLQFDNVEAGRSNISTQAWVPWYTMHKILAGLTDAYEVAGNEKALQVANKLGTWISNRANAWSTTKAKQVLAIEYGGMNDALYQLYKVTNASNKEDFKSAAHKFDETTLFDSVLAGGSNVLNGKHANTTIPKFLGALCRYEVDHTETKYLQYAEAFWQMVIHRHTYITGGNSEDEHFGADEVLDGERTVCNNETCNTYNMLKLSRRLFIITGEKKYADYYENTLINAIMSSQDHDTGLTMYFQPMASGYHKVFGTLDSNFWCCTGSGYENFTKLQDSIYFKKDNLVVVNQYLASTLTQEGYTIKQTGDLSKKDTMTLEVSGSNINVELRLRIPDWVVDGKPTVTIGDTEYNYTTRGGYIVIPNAKIADGATITVKLPMEVTAENLPDGENTYGFKYGPFVLSAKLGTSKQTTTSHGVAVTVPSGRAITSDQIGIASEDSVEAFIENINDYLVKDGDSMNFTLKGTNCKYTFTTHYNQDDENYGI
ncbi:MAG: glycoside hydrolase family 127 protein, partial [Eubacterium sp.]|nr:glycoside hydrolase family 127 protein [Eubacterium sp.]